uniref:ATP-binding cassette sub-family A member 3 n=1 Tax=Hemiscolopendra marginata TaxID=943146 RepID=A0A646QF11_9MYRI
MTAAKKILLIVWKNWLFRKRQKIMTIFEILIPTLLAIVLVVLRTQGGNMFAVKLNNATFYPKVNIAFDSLDLCFNNSKFSKPIAPNKEKYFYQNFSVLYTPNNTFTVAAMECLKSYFQSSRYPIKITLMDVPDENTMEEIAERENAKKNSNFWGGISFVNDFSDDSSFPESLHYRIRVSDTVKHSKWNTQFLLPVMESVGPNSQSWNYGYFDPSKFLLVQHLIAMFFIGTSTKRDLSSLEVFSQEFPYPEYFSDNGFNLIMSNMLPLFLCLSYVFIAPTLIKRIVCEKELGVKELMKMMGLHGWIQWVGWFFTSFIVMGISAIIIVFLLFVPFEPQAAVFNKTEPILFFIILLLYISCSITFCFFISSFFSKPSLATGIGSLIWIMSFTVPNYTLQNKIDSLTSHEKLSLALLPNMAMTLILRIIATFEGRNMGLQWEYLLSPSTLGDNINALQVMGMMVLNIFLYSFLTWYMDNVFPGIYGTKKPWYFLFTKSYWCSGDSNVVRKGTRAEKAENFEEDPIGLTPTVVIQNLIKEYTAGHRAVDDISLNIYKGQITALLGHNGAGKTTTMSILTGMIEPTAGTAYIEGIDISEDIDKARNSIGLCPQHNMLFDILTVKEHLMFFGKLKGANDKELKQEITELLTKLQLHDKRNTPSSQLSGGMKRKLHLGIALIGGTKVVMLDEPTSGMDPEARRAIWDLLQEMRKERCILLSTHFMEEADVLSDRIAIMAHGKIYCCGSTMFLKKRFGAGYHLNISISEDCDVTQLYHLVQRHIPEAYIDNHVNTEVSFVLSAEHTRNFPKLFEELEKKTINLGMNNFGISVTTMEEVFLKVGETAEDDRKLGNSESNITLNDGVELLRNSDAKRSVLEFNKGYELKLQQFWGLLMKRWHYGRRRWILIIGQIVVPVIIVIIILLINNNINLEEAMEPARVMDLSQYGDTIAVVNKNSALMNLASVYKEIIPPNSKVQSEENVILGLFNASKDNIASFNNEYIVAAEITQSNTSIINVLYNGIYYHTLPLTLNLMHNALLGNFSGAVKANRIIVENAPLPRNLVDVLQMGQMEKLIKSIMMGVFIPIGMSVLAASFVIFPIHERVTKAKHIQLMTGVGGILFWSASFLWDFLLHNVSSLLMLLFFGLLDTSNLLSGDGQLGVVYLVLILYGWCAIPFSYMISFVSSVPSSGFNRLTILNLIAGLTFSLMIFFFKFAGGQDLKTAGDILQWFARFIPIYPVTLCFMTIPQASIQNSMCNIDKLDIQCHFDKEVPPSIIPCCPNLCNSTDSCFKKMNYLQWDSPGVGQEVMMMMLDGCLYFVIIILIECGVMYKVWYYLTSFRKRQQNNVSNEIIPSSNLDSDVINESYRINDIINSGRSSGGDALLVHNLTKHFWNFAAVENLNFGVKHSECFGLLGVNGAGKTTTFRMLTGDEIVTSGNAYLNGLDLKGYRSQFLQKIAYCPQFDALIDHMNAIELLWLFARLRGISESQIPFEIEKTIDIFDLVEHKKKIVMALSGGNKRKLSSAIAFLGNSHMVFLDEPTTGVDPIARRKLWNILLGAKNAGVSIILTSHSMEECEVLCSRLAIMVNGQFQCIGGIQHLKNKFSQGFTIMAKLKSSGDQVQEAANQQGLQNYILQKFPNCSLKDVHQGIVHYQVVDPSVSWKYLFQTMEEAKEQFNLEDYSVSQATLEQIFLSFAKKQRKNEDPKSKKNK